jgi:geranylgeranyl diphosphate synthase type II
MNGEFTDTCVRWRASVEEGLQELSHNCGKGHTALVAPIQYVLLGGGKRLRALLALSLCRDLNSEAAHGDAINRALSSAVAIEALHAASLVHDDLPALDNDDTRRGKPSCHMAYGEATAILVGDALVGAAMFNVLDDETLPTDLRARVARVLSHVWRDLCVGQQVDLEIAAVSDPQARSQMIRLKTGILFGAAASCGAICAGIRDADIATYFEWGVTVGECFQALDDIDDGDRLESERAEIQGECLRVLRDLTGSLGVPDAGVSHSATRLILSLE